MFGKGQRHCDVQRLHPALAQRQRQRETDHDGEGQLPQSGGQRHRPDVADMVQVQLQSHREQQHRDTHLRQQVDLVVGRDQPEAGRAHRDAHDDVGDQHRLAQPHEDGAGQRADQQQEGELGEGTVHVCEAAMVIVVDSRSGRGSASAHTPPR